MPTSSEATSNMKRERTPTGGNVLRRVVSISHLQGIKRVRGRGCYHTGAVPWPRPPALEKRLRPDATIRLVSLVVFALILVVLAAAVGVPVLARRTDAVNDADAAVLGAVVLTLGLGGLNLAFVVGNVIFGDFGGAAVAFGLAPVGAGAVGLRAVGRLRGGGRVLALVGAAALTLAGIPGYFALPVAVVTSAAAALLFLAGLTDPRALLRRLDPRA